MATPWIAVVPGLELVGARLPDLAQDVEGVTRWNEENIPILEE